VPGAVVAVVAVAAVEVVVIFATPTVRGILCAWLGLFDLLGRRVIFPSFVGRVGEEQDMNCRSGG
jgi:hypothetical protein